MDIAAINAVKRLNIIKQSSNGCQTKLTLLGLQDRIIGVLENRFYALIVESEVENKE